MLAEGESIQAYQRKRLAMSFEKPIEPKRPKSHSPSDGNQSWSHEEASKFLTSHPEEKRINWSESARTLGIPGRNAGQVLKEYATECGFDTLALEQKSTVTPVRIRRSKKRLPQREISIPTLPPPSTITSEIKQFIADGKLTLGEPCSPHTVLRTRVSNEGEVITEEVNLIGRKLSLIEIRRKLLLKHYSYMRLLTTKQIEQLIREKIGKLMTTAHHHASDTATMAELQAQLASLQRTRTLAFWHNHSTVLQQGYIVFAVRVVYDPGVFYTDEEWRSMGNRTGSSIQEIIEQPTIHMIAPSTSSGSDQLALVPDRLECLEELSQKIYDKNHTPITDKARFFCGDKPAQQFERGTQIGGIYKCGSCGCKSHQMQDFAHAIQCPPRSLESLQSLIVAGKFGSEPCKLKPFDKLVVSAIESELTARGVAFQTNTKKQQLQELLTEELKGAQRVPSLLVLNPTQKLKDIQLGEYEVLDCEPLHDVKGHLCNLVNELPNLVLTKHKKVVTDIIETTTRQTSSAVHLRVAIIKVYLKLLKLKDVDESVVLLLKTVVKIAQLLYLQESDRNPRTVLQLYNATWLHHELCCQLIPTPKTQSRERFYGIYLHDLVVHAPMQYQMVCLRSTNAESTERLFSQIKHISQRATNRKPDNVLTTVLLSLQAKEESGTGTTVTTIQKQGTMVSEVAKNVPPYNGPYISTDFLKCRMPSWQAHLERISTYLRMGEGVWWDKKDSGYQFRDADTDPPTQAEGPTLLHFRSTNIEHIHHQSQVQWRLLLDENVQLPTPFIRIFNNGVYTGRKYYPTDGHKSAPSDNSESMDTEGPTDHSMDTEGSTDQSVDREGPRDHSVDTERPTPRSVDTERPTHRSVDTEGPTHRSVDTEGPIDRSMDTEGPTRALAITTLTLFSTTHSPSSQHSDASSQTRQAHTPITQGKSHPPVNLLIPFNMSNTPLESSAHEDNTSLQCEVKGLGHSKYMYRSKSAIQISNVLGENSTLQEYDTLRMRLKEQAKTPSIEEKAYYKKVLAKLHTATISNKEKLKTEIRNLERTHYQAHSTLPSSEQYKKIRTNLDNTRKLLNLWHKFDL